MRIVTGATMSALDRTAIEGRGIAGLDLMEYAGEGIAVTIQDLYPESNKPLIVCGKGNNGGDGFVVARLLRLAGVDPLVVSLADEEDLSPDAQHNFRRLVKESGSSVALFNPDDGFFKDFLFAIGAAEADLVVDGIFGTGFRGEVRGEYIEIIETLNAIARPHVAIDMPSGVCADDGSVGNIAFRADLTITMALPKIGQFVPPGQDYAGIVRVVPIGIPADLISQRESGEAELLDQDLVAQWLPRYPLSCHKGSRGHLLVVSGSPGMTGAGCLAAEASLVSGVGLVTVAVPGSLNPIYEAKLTEAMTLPLPDEGAGRLIPSGFEALRRLLAKVDAVVFGPGVGTDPRTGQFLEDLLREATVPVLIDADGLNLLAGRLEVLHSRFAPTILTPHPGEMGRLLSISAKEVQADRWGCATRLSRKTGAVVILKGAGTVITDGEDIFVNPTGNPAMSQGGMGDVLSGAVGARLAGGLEPTEASVVGVFLHGSAADHIVSETGWTVVRAGEVIEALRDAEGRVRLLARRNTSS